MGSAALEDPTRAAEDDGAGRGAERMMRCKTY